MGERYSCSYTQHRDSQTVSWAIPLWLPVQLWHGETDVGSCGANCLLSAESVRPQAEILDFQQNQ